MISSLKPYDDYKETGLPWAPVVPKHWELFPNRAIVRKRKVLVGKRHSEYKLLSLTKGGVIVRDISTGKGKFSSDMGTSQEVRKGDLVFCLFDVPETPRTVGKSCHDGMITGAYTVFECRDRKPVDFFERFYIAMDDRKLLSPLYSGLRNTIPPERFLGTKTPLPPPEEQEAIVRFLDHAHGRIDRAIRAKRKVIALLNEQKQAIIHKAVTRGLNPDAPLKPSGIPWLGDIPAHWEQLALWSLSKLRTELNPGDLPLLSVFLDRGVIRYEEGGGQVHAPSLDLSNYQVVRMGDFVLNNQQAWRGSVGVSSHDGIISPAYIVLRLSKKLNTAYSNYLFRSRSMVDQFVAASKGVGDIQRQVFWPFLRIVQVPVPLLVDQKAIADFLDKETAGINRGIAQLEREIELLREYRTRLTADVITGKLDVREAAKSLPAESEETHSDDTLSDPDLEGDEEQDLEEVEG
jgi:type I restriction enzyme S subunit